MQCGWINKRLEAGKFEMGEAQLVGELV
jgi:hypothetical protein